jgi:hypothetical protein
MSAEIEGEFLQEVERAEELSKAIEPGMCLIFCILCKFVKVFCLVSSLYLFYPSMRKCDPKVR